MEIVNKKQINVFVKVTLFVIILLIIIPLAFYIYNFYNSNMSHDTNDWGNVGDYLSGTIGTLFSLVAAFFSLISIYITLVIATKIQEADNQFNINSLQRENERFQKEIELTHKQNKPYPFFDIIKLNNITKITLSNYGTGPMIVKDLHFQYSESEKYQNVMLLFAAKVLGIKKTITIHYLAASKLIVPANSSKDLLEIIPTIEETTEYRREQSELRNVLSNCKICFSFEDIFENRKEQSINLVQFKDHIYE